MTNLEISKSASNLTIKINKEQLMNYLLAYVHFDSDNKLLAFSCSRTDIRTGDRVLAWHYSAGVHAFCVIHSLRYSNCSDVRGRIMCKESESEMNEQGRWIPKLGTPSSVGITNVKQLADELLARGWTNCNVKGSQAMGWSRHLGYYNGQQTARIFIRCDLITFYIVDGNKLSLSPIALALHRENNAGPWVRHELTDNTFNLLEGVVRFACAFEEKLCDYDRFFIPQGRKPASPRESKSAETQLSSTGEERSVPDDWEPEFVEPVGIEDRVYLGDGMYVTKDGRFEND